MSTAPDANYDRRIFNDVLPSETLGHIFLELARDSSLFLCHVLFVSRSLYIAASQFPTLWTTIRVDYTLHNYFFASGEWRMNAALHYVQWCLDHSRDMPLHVVLDFSGLQAGPR